MKNTSVSSAAASGGVTGAAVVLVTWLLSLAHIEVPAEVAASLMVILAPALHLAVVRLGVEPPEKPAAPATQPAP